jgi:phage gpG-like protein
MIQKDRFGFHRLLNNLNRKFKKDITTKVGQHSLLFFKVQYQKQGTDKSGFIPWKDRKYKVNRKLLVKTNAMRNSMKITSKRFERTVIAITVPYAKYHQFGTKYIPKREMLYESEKLNKQVKSIITKELNKYFNSK